MAHSEVESGDARQQPREQALNGATILDAAGNAVTRCLVTNMSKDGAELELTSNVRVPPQFTLQVPREGVTYRAQARWRENGRVGVEFFGREKAGKPALRAVS